MSTRSTLFQTPTVEVDQARFEELIRNEQKYEQYKAAADSSIRQIIEAGDTVIDSGLTAVDIQGLVKKEKKHRNQLNNKEDN